MASTYTTGFGIEKIGSGEQDGAWGTTTNHNLDILDRIASYKAVAISGTTHTLTVREAAPGTGTENLQDGMYRVIKFTGALAGNNTVTIAPNTAPAYFIIENATTDSGSSGPYSVILSQGGGANITVQNGKNAVVYCDGAGSGAAVVNALSDLQIATLEVTGAAAVDGALAVTGVTTHGGNVVSDTDSTDSLGTTSTRWLGTWTDAINGVTAPTAQYTSAEATKLSGIEASADVTDATNVASALANGVAALTSGEVTQLANIGTEAISAAEWGYVAGATAAFADNSVTLARMASGTDGNVISYDASGNPVAVATGNDGQVLTSTGAGSPPAFEDAAAGGEFASANGGVNNLYAGSTAGDSLTSGTNNFLAGLNAGTALTDGTYNVALGSGALDAAASTSYSIAIGANAMGVGVVTGVDNIAIGQGAGNDLTSATNSVFIGKDAGANATTGAQNIAIGGGGGTLAPMGGGVTTGGNNTTLNASAGYALTSGTDSVFIGRNAGKTITTGSYNVAVGYGAIGRYASANPTYTVAIGASAIGAGAATGANNVAIGRNAGNDLTSGASNVFIGAYAGDFAAFATGSNTMALGNGATPSAADVSNEITLGDGSIATSRIEVDWTILSDKRDKANIKPLLAGLDFVNDLKPVSFQWDKRELYCIVEEVVTEATFDEDGVELTPETSETVRTPAVQDGSKLNPNTTMGFLSQDVMETIEKFGEAATGDLILATNLERLELQRGGLIVPLVNAVKELSAKVDAQDALIATLITRLKILEGV